MLAIVHYSFLFDLRKLLTYSESQVAELAKTCQTFA